MNSSGFLILASSFVLHVNAQNSTQDQAQLLHPFHPSLVAIIGVMAVMFSVVILVVAYAKFCNPNSANRFRGDAEFQGGLHRIGSRFSGIDRSAIEKIPIFRFSSLRGTKRGLECAVCLSKFEDIEILRLLPKCKHAFHRNCIDKWLESHSSCPLCRQTFEAQDITTFTFSNSLRFTQTPSNLTDDPNVELFIQREHDHPGPSRFNFGGSFRKFDKNKTRDPLSEHKQQLHKLKHKIIVSDVVVQHRWSDVNSSDFLALNSDMLKETSSQRFSRSKSVRFSPGAPMGDHVLKIKDDMDKKRLFESKVSMLQRSSSVSTSANHSQALQTRLLHHSEKRSMSEITNVSRFRDLTGKSKAKECPSTPQEERVRRTWLPMAQRTLQWFSNLDKNQPRPDEKLLPPKA